MTMQVNKTFVNNFFAGITAQLTGATYVEIYSGEIPESADGITSSTHSDRRLARVTAFTLEAVNRTLRFGNIPSGSLNATATGVATWFSIISSSYVLLGTITDQVDGTGVLILENVNLVAGTPVNVIELGARIF